MKKRGDGLERRPPAGTAARRAANHVPPLGAIVPQARERRPPAGTAARRAANHVPPLGAIVPQVRELRVLPGARQPKHPQPAQAGAGLRRRAPPLTRTARDSGAPASSPGGGLRPASRESATPAPMTLCHANVRPAALPLSPGGRDRSLRPRRTVRARRAHPGTHPPPPIRPKPLQIPSTHPSADTGSPRKSGTFFEAHDRRSAAPGIPSVNTSATRMTGLSRRRDTFSGRPSGRGERRAGIRHRPGGRRWRARRNTLRIDRNGRVTLPCRAGTGDPPRAVPPPPQSGPPGRTRLAALPGALRDPLRPPGGDGLRRRPAAADGGCCGSEGAALTGEAEARRHRTPQPLDCRARSAPRRLPAVTAPPDADSYSGPRRGPSACSWGR